MATGPHFQLRRRKSAAQLYAISQVEREIRAADPHSSRKYVREFAEAFQSYRGPVSRAELAGELNRADVLLVADYHALPASQDYAAQLIQQLSTGQRPLALALEAIYSRDQRILDSWQERKLDDRELRERIRYDSQWGFSWEPFLRLLKTARSAGARIYAMDCVPRDDLRRIASRDEHAAERIAAITRLAPEARIVVLFGESHMAPQHLPAEIKRRLPAARMLTLLQNIDPLYWEAGGERGTQVEAVRVSEDVLCVFSATPLEKYESYRQCLTRWRLGGPSALAFTPSFYNVVSALSRFLGIDSCQDERWPCLAELLPEIIIRPSAAHFLPLLRRRISDQRRLRELIGCIDREGCAYSMETNSICAERFELSSAAAAAARFVHAACSGLLEAQSRPSGLVYASSEDRFYALCLSEAMADFGARILHPGRSFVEERELYAHYSRIPAELEAESAVNYRDYLRMLDLVELHRDFECNAHLYRRIPHLISEGRAFTGSKLHFVTTLLGQSLGTRSYQLYLAGGVDRRYLRSLFFRHLEKPGEPKLAYFQLARRTRGRSRRLAA
jgi:hypothetical protein